MFGLIKFMKTKSEDHIVKLNHSLQDSLKTLSDRLHEFPTLENQTLENKRQLLATQYHKLAESGITTGPEYDEATAALGNWLEMGLKTAIFPIETLDRPVGWQAPKWYEFWRHSFREELLAGKSKDSLQDTLKTLSDRLHEFPALEDQTLDNQRQLLAIQFHNLAENGITAGPDFDDAITALGNWIEIGLNSAISQIENLARHAGWQAPRWYEFWRRSFREELLAGKVSSLRLH